MLLTICNYFKKCFCKHDFEFLKQVQVYERETDTMPIHRKLIYRCKKCGYVQKIKY